VVVNVFLISTIVVLNHFAKEIKYRPTILLESRIKNLPQVNWHVLFCCTNEVCYTSLEVLLKDITLWDTTFWSLRFDSYRKESFPSKNQTLSSYRVGLYISPTK